jgi:hypothetical protein
MNDIPLVVKERGQFAHEKVSAVGIHRPSRLLLSQDKVCLYA